MKSLILPLCGKSSRFPNVKPKWMLTHPDGDFMVVSAIKGLNLSFFDHIYFVTLEEHEVSFKFLKGLKENLKDNHLDKVKVVQLGEETTSQPETVYQCIRKEKIKGFIFIKDCDNFFELNIKNPTNQVAFSDLKDFELINARNKSYIKINKNGIIENIIEKEIISTTFCCGGYGFESAKDFARAFEELSRKSPSIYVSDIIFKLMLDNMVFYGALSSNYVDWGTIHDWNRYKDKFKTLFLDIDGTIVKNSSSHFPPYIGSSDPLINNIKRIQELAKENNLHICITTSRAEKYRKSTEKELKKIGIPYNTLIMGLPHGERILINDFSLTNPYPSCSAINLVRDLDNLERYI